MKIVFALELLVLLVGCSQYVPIPQRSHGLTLGDPKGTLRIRAFYDLLCIDSKKSNDNLREALTQRGYDGIKLTYDFFPLPYHLYSFKVHQGYQYVRKVHGDRAANKYIQFVLKNQAVYYESKWTKFSVEEFLDGFTNDIAQVLEIDEVSFRKSLNSGSPEDSKVRAEWKYASGTLGNSGTPIYYANGVRIDAAEDWSTDKWLAFFHKQLDK